MVTETVGPHGCSSDESQGSLRAHVSLHPGWILGVVLSNTPTPFHLPAGSPPPPPSLHQQAPGKPPKPPATHEAWNWKRKSGKKHPFLVENDFSANDTPHPLAGSATIGSNLGCNLMRDLSSALLQP